MGASPELISVPGVPIHGDGALSRDRLEPQPGLAHRGIGLLEVEVTDRARSRRKSEVELGRRLGRGDRGEDRAAARAWAACRNHRGKPAVRMSSAGIHPETSPVGAPRLSDVLAFGNNAKSVRCC